MNIDFSLIKVSTRAKILPKVFKLSVATLGAFLYVSFLSVLILKWVVPPTSSFMLQDKMATWWAGSDTSKTKYQWKDWDEISPYIKVAVVTSEDQNFAEHWGFDFKAIEKAIAEYQEGQNLRGASTITQQVAKNLFLWPGKSYIRKGLEAYFTVLIETLWSKKRILEVYVNIAQFGDHIYGAPAACGIYFKSDAGNLGIFESALLATALPSPRRYNLGNPSDYMLERRMWIVKYMLYLGLDDYLNRIED